MPTENQSASRERPILFGAPMVRAILEGRKTVTRRALKLQPISQPEPTDSGTWEIYRADELAGTIRCPYGQPGDRLWVRETWQGPLVSSEEMEADPSWHKDATRYQDPAHCAYRASGDSCEYVDPDDNFHCRWRPSIHMPRWASRILLEVTAVRVERLESISFDQARAEGYPKEREAETGGSDMDAWLWFRSIWEEINGAGSYEATPWVWCVEFRRVTP